MRVLKVITGVMVLLSFVGANAQRCGDNTSKDISSVSSILVELKAGLYSSMGEKRLERFGDRAAVLAIRSNTIESMENESTATAIARMITIAFKRPGLISTPQDQDPKMSLILLTYLKPQFRTAASIKVLDNAMSVIKKERKSQ